MYVSSLLRNSMFIKRERKIPLGEWELRGRYAPAWDLVVAILSMDSMNMAWWRYRSPTKAVAGIRISGCNLDWTQETHPRD